MKRVCRAIAMLLVLGQIDSAQAQAAADSRPCFRVFDASGFKGKPDLSRYGIEPATVIYAGNHFWPGKQNMERLPERSAVRFTIERWITSRGPLPPLTVLDVEHWPDTGDPVVVAESVEKYLTLLRWVKEDLGSSPVGYYGIPPLRDFWRATTGESSELYKQWQAENDRFVRLADAVEVFTPSLYTFYDNQKSWEQYALANVRETRRLARGKPVYPFIWPHYHDSSKVKGYVSKEYWALQLRTLETVADGVVIWAGQEVWDPQAGWWQATREFIESSPRVCKRVRPEAPKLESTRR